MVKTIAGFKSILLYIWFNFCISNNNNNNNKHSARTEHKTNTERNRKYYQAGSYWNEVTGVLAPGQQKYDPWKQNRKQTARDNNARQQTEHDMQWEVTNPYYTETGKKKKKKKKRTSCTKRHIPTGHEMTTRNASLKCKSEINSLKR